MSLFYIGSPQAEMREEPSASSKVVSQAFHSELVEIHDQKQDWVHIKTPDQYMGWVLKHHLISKEKEIIFEAQVIRPSAHIYSINDIEYGPTLTLPFESGLEFIEEPQDPEKRWCKIRLVNGFEGYLQSGDLSKKSQVLKLDEMLSLSHLFLGLPYTWGGRTSFGYDCSGYVQMLYRQIGVFLPRDAKDQIASEQLSEITFQDLKAGDLLFFGYTPEKIRHVGMYIGDNKMIHTSSRENKPFLRISNPFQDAEWNGNGVYKYCTARRLKSWMTTKE